jgi:hypothetical protein
MLHDTNTGMWPQEFRNLEELKVFMVHQLGYDEQTGFSFLQIAPGMDLEKISVLLGEAHESNMESEQQQTLQYYAPIDHPIHGKRDHHRLSALFWAFHREPLEMITLHIDYYKTGELKEDFHKFVKELFVVIIEKLGNPDTKSSGVTKKISYLRGKHKFFLWSNAEGIRIQIK